MIVPSRSNTAAMSVRSGSTGSALFAAAAAALGEAA